jgi:hypothetical protein
VLGLLGIGPLLFLAARRFESTSLRLLCITWFAVASIGAALAANSGHEAEERVEQAGLSNAEKAAVHEHEELGENGWIWPLIPLVLVAGTFVPRRAVRIGAGVLAIGAAIGVGAWVGATGKAGGRLVYEFGLGVPVRGGAALPPARHEPEDKD